VPEAPAGLLGRVAVLVVSYNTGPRLRECLAALSAPDAGELEMVVVDNASEDGSAAMVSEEFPGVRLHPAAKNLGFGTAANVAAGMTERQYLLMLNPDCVAGPGAVAELAARLDAEPALGFAGPKILLESGRVDHACLRGDPDPVGAALYLSRAARLFPRSPRVNRYSLRHLDYDQEQELLAGTAACLMVRAQAFRVVGGFDEEFFMYGEDLDLCRRLREAGAPGRYVPSAVVTHIKGESSRQHSGRMLLEFHRAMWTYYRKHEAARRPPPLNWSVAAGISVLAGARMAVNTLRREKRVSAR
jgi:GT2 family glycosyltransferase